MYFRYLVAINLLSGRTQAGVTDATTICASPEITSVSPGWLRVIFMAQLA